MSESSSPPSSTGNKASSAHVTGRMKAGSLKGGKSALAKSAIHLASPMTKKAALAKRSVADAAKTLTTKKTGSSHGALAHQQGIPKTKKALSVHAEKATAGDAKGKAIKPGSVTAEKGEATVKGKIDRGSPKTLSSASKFAGTFLSKHTGYYKGDKGFKSKTGGEAAGGQTGSGNIASGLGTTNLKPGSNAGSGRQGIGHDKATGHDDEIGAPVVGLRTGRQLSYAVTAASMSASSGDAAPSKDGAAVEGGTSFAQVFRHHMMRIASESGPVFGKIEQAHILATLAEGTESRFWQATKQQGITLLATRHGIPASEAVDDAFAKTDDFILDGGSAVALIAARADLATVGRQAFDRRYADGLIIGGMPDGGHFASRQHSGMVGRTSEIMETGSSRWTDRTKDGRPPRLSPFDSEEGDQLIAGDVYAFMCHEDRRDQSTYKAAIYLGEDAKGTYQFWEAKDGIVNITIDAHEQFAMLITDGPLAGYDLTAFRLKPPADLGMNEN